MNEELKVKVVTFQAGYIVILFGSLDVYTESTLEKLIYGLVEEVEGKLAVIIDLGHLEFTDSSGVDVIKRMVETLKSHGIKMAIARPQQNVLYHMQFGKVAESVEIFSTLAVAKRKLLSSA